jgi:hypothetical protein
VSLWCGTCIAIITALEETKARPSNAGAYCTLTEGWGRTIPRDSYCNATVNGAEHQLDVPDEMLFLWVPRDIVGLTGTMFGCGVALCGACFDSAPMVGTGSRGTVMRGMTEPPEPVAARGPILPLEPRGEGKDGMDRESQAACSTAGRAAAHKAELIISCCLTDHDASDVEFGLNLQALELRNCRSYLFV